MFRYKEQKIGTELKNRVSENRGATLMVGLLFFMLCAVAGSVILAAASAAAGRAGGVVRSEQQQITVNAGASYLKGLIENKELVFSNEDGAEEGLVITDAEGSNLTDGEHYANFQYDLLVQTARTIYLNPTDKTLTEKGQTLTIEVPAASGTGDILLFCTYKMDKNFNITIDVCEGEDGDAGIQAVKGSMTVQLYIPASISPSLSGQETVDFKSVRELHVRWANAEITAG